MTYYLMYYVLAISQSKREIHVNILDQDAPIKWQDRYSENHDLKTRH